jgi:REP element-mobilizing transposase RayT
MMDDEYKTVITNSLQHLSDIGKIDVFAFVIMPNHMHMIWRLNAANGKESPHASFLKHTAHEFKKKIISDKKSDLEKYKAVRTNKLYEFWQRDSLAVKIYDRDMALQKLNYIHHNPVAKHWALVDDFAEYEFSSAAFYEKNIQNFAFLKWLWDEI